jgi:hypothetical protein
MAAIAAAVAIPAGRATGESSSRRTTPTATPAAQAEIPRGRYRPVDRLPRSSSSQSTPIRHGAARAMAVRNGIIRSAKSSAANPVPTTAIATRPA